MKKREKSPSKIIASRFKDFELSSGNISLYQKILFLGKITGFRRQYAFIPILCSLVAACLEAVTFAMLLPLLQAIFLAQYEPIRQLFYVRGLLEILPAALARSDAVLISLMLVLIYAASLLKSYFRYISRINICAQVQDFCENLRSRLFSRYLRFDGSFFDEHGHGYLNQILMAQVSKLGHLVVKLHSVWNAFCVNLAYLGVLVFLSWKATLVLMLISPPMYFIGKITANRLRKLSEVMVSEQVKLEKNVFNILSCISLVKSSGSEEKEEEEFSDTCERIGLLQFNMDRMREIVVPFQEIITVTILLLLAVFVSLVNGNPGPSEIARYLVFLYVARLFVSNLAVITRLKAYLSGFEGPVNRVLYFFDDEGKSVVSQGDRIFKGLKQGIHIKNLTFSYYKDIPVLKNLTAVFPKGGRIALVGPSGAGKSTLIKLLLRLYEHPQGSIYLDDVELNEFTMKSTRDATAYVCQDPLLLHDSFKNNLIYGIQRNVSDSEIETVIEKAMLKDLLNQLPQGMESVIGDRGVRLSGGEKQRLSLARAMLKQAEIIILDEPTSAMDSFTEQKITQAIKNIAGNKTIITIAHRLSTIQNSDQILVIEQGGVIESGSYDELIASRGKFYSYCIDQNHGIITRPKATGSTYS